MANTVNTLTAVLEYEDAAGRLTGDSDVYQFYSCDPSTASLYKLGTADTSGAKSFVFTRGNCRLTDVIISATATNLPSVQLVINNMARNIKWYTAAQAPTALRTRTNFRIAGGSQVEFLAVST